MGYLTLGNNVSEIKFLKNMKNICKNIIIISGIIVLLLFILKLTTNKWDRCSNIEANKIVKNL
jgi:hypothetical protein